jgi:hypothetical protein
LILLSISLYSNRIFNRLIPLLLIIGAILFPIGRIGRFAFAVIGGGMFLTAAFGLIAWQVINPAQNADAVFLIRFYNLLVLPLKCW